MSSEWTFPFWIAHRGAGKLAPENTLAAFRLGAQYGYRAFECDVKLSADGVPFLLHDATLERTTNGRGIAGDLNWAELSRLDAGSWHSRLYAGESLPSLSAVAAFVQRNGFALDLEIKPTPGLEAHTGAVVADEVARLWHGHPQVPLLSSFQPESLRAALDSVPELPRALLLDSLPAGALDQALELRCVALITNHKLMDAALAARVHAAGMRAMVYTVNEPERASQLLACGINGLVTDAVDRFSASGYSL
jgi:glycerophosphoryl diester phosphodiesterase